MNLNDENGWMVPSHNGYLEFPKQDDSGIAVTVWNHLIPVKPHRHTFFEFALVSKGYCTHRYRGVEVPLIPGDVFLIKPNEEHSYQIHVSTELINCQFFPDELSGDVSETLEGVGEETDLTYGRWEIQSRWNDLIHALSDSGSDEKTLFHSRQSDLNKQGVIHLDMKGRREIEFLLNCMMEEQTSREEGMERVKLACLQMILVKFKRVQKRQYEQLNQHRDRRKEKIYEILSCMEEHLDEEADFADLASRVGWSVGYFRTVFKDVTGLTPTEYLNRIKILKSMELMQKEDLNVSEAAERVGFYDPAYYSRLFKKVMGYSPKYFKQKK